MKRIVSITAAFSVGLLIGGGVVQKLQALTSSNVYWIGIIDEVVDASVRQKNTNRSDDEASKLLDPFDGNFLSRNAKITGLDGEPPRSIIIAQFPNREKALGWYNSPGQTQVNDIRRSSTKSRSFIVDGIAVSNIPGPG